MIVTKLPVGSGSTKNVTSNVSPIPSPPDGPSSTAQISILDPALSVSEEVWSATTGST